jgi:hypothetical protein
LYGAEPDTLIVDELGVCSAAVRIDVAVVNGALHGFEIKSQLDTLERLPSQQEIYSRVFDTVTLVAAGRHLRKVEQIIPKWWGVQQIVDTSPVRLNMVRPNILNQGVDSYSVAQLLWHNEALAALEAVGAAAGMRRRPRRHLYEALAALLPLDVLRRVVRTAIKARGDWRSAPLRRSSGATYRPFATS